MPLLSKEELKNVYRRALSHDASYAQRAVDGAQTRLHGQLARTQTQNTSNVARLAAVVDKAEEKGQALQKQLPQLAHLADTAVGEERAVHHHNYLQAAQNIERCAQIRDAATRELIIARNH